MQTFEPWSPAHLTVVSLTFVVPVAAALWSRQDPTDRRAGWVKTGLSVVLVSQLIAGFFFLALPTADTWADVLPLQLCHLALFACVAACLTRSQFAYDLAYFWGLAGTFQGLITPGLTRGFPSLEFILFFVGHGGIIATVLFLTFGGGYRPWRSSVVRAFLALLAYAAVVGSINALLGQNYGYLCSKPAVPTLFDLLGPWPWYIGNAALLAAILFLVLYVPWELADRMRDSESKRVE